jgi:hypothetical protein
MFDQGIVENPLTSPFKALQDRVKQGFVGELDVRCVDDAGTQSSSVKAGLGYTFADIAGVRFGVVGYGRLDFNVGKNSKTAGLSVLVRKALGKSTIEAYAGVETSEGADDARFFGSLGLRF